MNRRQLMIAIRQEFQKAGMLHSWIYKEYLALKKRNQLPRFQIVDMQWFKGADIILELVDQLDTLITPYKDFIALADKLDIEIPNRMKKNKVAKIVKSNQAWRIKAFELDLQKRLNQESLPK